MLASLLASAEIRAQLAITEVMSWASTNCPGCHLAGPRGCHPDFWELTNFGTNTIDLTGYRFGDENAVRFEDAHLLPSTEIAAGESIIFVRNWPEVPDAAAFRQWWGESNLPADLQILFYLRPGFDFLGDAVLLWDADTNLVEKVYFGEARQGFTFAYDTNSGAVMQSTQGVCGAFQAATCGDVGSPGWAPCGPVPLRITRQPVSQTVDAGADVTFEIEATALPRPRGFQWYFNGAPVSIDPSGPNAISWGSDVPIVVNYAGCGVARKPGPKPNDLTIPNVQPSHTGQYYVVVTNGLEWLTSAVVTLTVNINPTPPTMDCPPAELLWPTLDGQPRTNLVVAPLQTATLEVLLRGYPPPTFRWSWSGDGSSFVNLPGATNSTLILPFVSTNTIPGHAGLYRVRVQNALGTTNAYARLTVREKPRLKITEAMADSCFAAEDWWELTNLDDEPVDLYGYRWDENPGIIGGGPTITNIVVVQPGESVIFLEGQGNAPEIFVESWGATNLPTGLQFITYTANGLLFEGDEINIWNPTATDDSDWIDQVVFSRATPGASFWFAPNDPCSEFGVPSVAGECGAFRSAQGCDEGSPGWTLWTPPCLTSIRRDGAEVRLEWKAQPGSTNLVQHTSALAAVPATSTWIDLGAYSFVTAAGYAIDTTLGQDSQRFYRVVRVAPDNCTCLE